MPVNLAEKVTRLTELTSDGIPLDGFIVYCEHCEAAWGTDKKRYALRFFKHHRTHTDHEASKVMYGETFLTRQFYAVECGECGEEWVFEREANAEKFVDEHHLHLGHSVENPRRISKPSSDSI